jgi:hypothetical protein
MILRSALAAATKFVEVTHLRRHRGGADAISRWTKPAIDGTLVASVVVNGLAFGRQALEYLVHPAVGLWLAIPALIALASSTPSWFLLLAGSRTRMEDTTRARCGFARRVGT